MITRKPHLLGQLLPDDYSRPFCARTHTATVIAVKFELESRGSAEPGERIGLTGRWRCGCSIGGLQACVNHGVGTRRRGRQDRAPVQWLVNPPAAAIPLTADDRSV